MQDDGGHAVVVRRRAAGEVWLLEEALKTGAVKGAGVVGVVAAGAVLDENLVAAEFPRGELAEGLRGRKLGAASGEQAEGERRWDQFGSLRQGIPLHDTAVS